MIKISPDLQLDIFQDIFLKLIEYPSFRWKLKEMISSWDRVDNAELDLKFKKLELEILKKKGGQDVL